MVSRDQRRGDVDHAADGGSLVRGAPALKTLVLTPLNGFVRRAIVVFSCRHRRANEPVMCRFDGKTVDRHGRLGLTQFLWRGHAEC